MTDMLPDPAVLAAYTAAVALLTLTPGPDMALFIGRTIAGGRRLGFAAFLGTAAGLVVHSALAAVGLSALLAASATAFTLLKIAGAGYLLLLAVEAVRKGSAFRLDGGAAAESAWRTFAKGFTVNVLNPKIVVFFVTFLPQFVEPDDPAAAAQLFLLGLWYVVVTFPLTVVMILGAERLAVLLRTRPKLLRAIDWAFAGVMGAFAVRLLTARAAAGA